MYYIFIMHATPRERETERKKRRKREHVLYPSDAHMSP